MRWNVSLDFEECSEFSLYKINDRVSNEDSNFYCLLNELWIQSKSVYLCIRQYSYHFLIKIIIYQYSHFIWKRTHTLFIYQLNFLPQKAEGVLTQTVKLFRVKVRLCCSNIAQWETPLARWKPNTVLHIYF